MRLKLPFCLLLGASLIGGTMNADAGIADDDSVILSFGGNYSYIYTQPETAWGYSASALFPPGRVAQVSETISRLGMGMALSYNKTFVEEVGRYEGGEVICRKYLGTPGRRARYWLGGGLGLYHVRWEGATGGSSKSSLVFSGGVEIDLGSRFILDVELVNRSLEFATNSLSGSAVILMLGMRIDP
ncbi:MAG: hypothetical protein GY835_17765 [bacterium]|nr:hypothetical protein [bacterium]